MNSHTDNDIKIEKDSKKLDDESLDAVIGGAANMSSNDVVMRPQELTNCNNNGAIDPSAVPEHLR